MITKKQILKRMKSLEEYLGVNYVSDTEYPFHVNDDWGVMYDLKKIRSEHRKAKDKLEELEAKGN